MVSGIVMASGFSSRMGQCKLLLNYRGNPLIEMVLEAVEKSGLEPKIVVTGNKNVGDLAKGRNLQVIINKNGNLGQSESIKLGVLNSDDADGYAFIVGDQPYINHSFIDQLIDEFEEHKDNIIVPIHGGIRGNPVIFPKKYRDDLLSLQGDMGGRVLLKKYSEYIRFIEIKEEDILLDIDTKEDYLRLIEENQL